MYTIQDLLSADTKYYAHYKKKIAEIEKKIDREARELLGELRKLEGWECLIEDCEEHFAKYPNEFFNWCYVTHTADTVQFFKTYPDDGEYKVLEISFRKSLKDQIRDRMVYLAAQREKEAADERQRDLIQLERIKKKYGL